MVTFYIVTIAFAMLCVTALAFIVFKMLETMREDRKERARLLDRIQAGSFNEYKAQERADLGSVKRKEKTKEQERLEREAWL